jgi:hypothetical protein
MPPDRSRDLWFEVEFELSNKKAASPLIGGLCYAGDPFLPYWITPQGENSANFGLPREIQVAWNGHQAATFLDGECAIVHHDPFAHSGVHVLPTGPISGDRVTVRFADFPQLVGDERMGVFLPFLYFFAYEEDVRFRPRVPAGLLAATQVPASTARAYVDLPGVAADYVFTTDDPDEYFPMSAASVVGSPREYAVHIHGLNGDRVETLTEAFVSQAMEKGDQVRLFLAQTEEHPRCLAGLTLSFPDPKGVQYVTDHAAALLDVRIYEIDAVECLTQPDHVGQHAEW